MGGRHCRARRYGIASDISINQPHRYILRQGIQCSLGGGIGCPTEWARPVYRRNIDDDTVIFRHKDLQSFTDISHRSAQVRIHHVQHPLIIGFVNHLLLANPCIVDQDIHIPKFI